MRVGATRAWLEGTHLHPPFGGMPAPIGGAMPIVIAWLGSSSQVSRQAADLHDCPQVSVSGSSSAGGPHVCRLGSAALDKPGRLALSGMSPYMSPRTIFGP
jgi:hypothetical protein